ncbi:MAG TPA: D-amino acid dehydrogenase [Rubrivivax sp.]
MRVAVVGAGIIGVTTAYELSTDGHEVTVFERCASVAAEGSFANAGVIAPGYVTPWAAPGMPLKVLKHLFARHAPVRFGAGTLAATPWLWRFVRACGSRTHVANRTRMQALAQLSRDRLADLSTTLRLEYEQASGYLVLMRTPLALAQAQPGIALLRELGVAFEVVDAARCHTIEPALHPGAPLYAAIHLPRDGVGNCRQFAHLMKAHAQALGARFWFGHQVHRLTPGQGVELEVSGPDSAQGLRSESFDAVVVCAGSEAGALLKPLGISLPLLPVYGYSVTAPVRQIDGIPDSGPRSALMDERYKVAISRLGQRIRIAGSAEIGGRPGDLRAAALHTLYKVLEDWFPGAADLAKAQHWKGARPMLPDGPPVIGPSGAPGVWLNLGHGSSGWALSCGSARVLADLVGGRAAPIDVAGLGIERLR